MRACAGTVLGVAFFLKALLFAGYTRYGECSELVNLPAGNGAGDSPANSNSTPDQHPQEEEPPNCTVDDLLPGLQGGLQNRWVPLAQNETRPWEYDCSCPYPKARCDLARAPLYHIDSSVWQEFFFLTVASPKTSPQNLVCRNQKKKNAVHGTEALIC